MILIKSASTKIWQTIAPNPLCSFFLYAFFHWWLWCMGTSLGIFLLHLKREASFKSRTSLCSTNWLRRTMCLRRSGKELVCQSVCCLESHIRHGWSTRSLDTERSSSLSNPLTELQLRLHSEVILQFCLQSRDQWAWPHCDTYMHSTHNFSWRPGTTAVQVQSQIWLKAFCQNLWAITHSWSWLKPELSCFQGELDWGTVGLDKVNCLGLFVTVYEDTVYAFIFS